MPPASCSSHRVSLLGFACDHFVCPQLPAVASISGVTRQLQRPFRHYGIASDWRKLTLLPLCELKVVKNGKGCRREGDSLCERKSFPPMTHSRCCAPRNTLSLESRLRNCPLNRIT